MSLKPLLSFSSGELDPILHDRVTLEKFNSGLATARNVMISKTGSILSRFSTALFVKAKNDDQAIKLFSPPNSGKLLEFGHEYVRIYDFDGTLDGEIVTPYQEEDLYYLHFVPSKNYVYIFISTRIDVTYTKLIYVDGTLGFDYTLADIPAAPTSFGIVQTGSPTGVDTLYLMTKVFNGEESETSFSGFGLAKPAGTGQINQLTATIDTDVANINNYDEVRIYSRPENGGAYGFLGASTDIYVDGSVLKAQFEDLGGSPDYSQNPQKIVTAFPPSTAYLAGLLFPKTGIVYQQRLLIANLLLDVEAILASRPGYQNNFYRDVPYSADSALKFKAGTTGSAEVLRMVDSDGLIVFTTVGVYVNTGLLSVNNVALEKKGSWVIDEAVPPLVVPGGVFFVDKSTNSIRQLIFSQDILTYETIDHTIFSDHLFTERTIKSWAFQEGVVPLIIVNFSDGTWATFTYHFEHQMRAWTRHDSIYPIEQVEGTGVADSTFFVVNKDGNRYIEVSLPRKIPADTFESNPEADKISLNAFMDGAKTKSNLLNDSLVGADVFELVPVVADDWEGELTLTCGTSALFPDPGLGAEGTILRFFDTEDKTVVDLLVTARASDNELTVEPSAEFPLDQATDFRLYETFSVVDGLEHLEGENVSIMVDGNVANSPNNDVEEYYAVVVSGGQITIPDDERGAIIVVGRPITADIKTLNVTTVEQSPTMIESQNIGKLYIRLHKSRGLFISNRFPEELVNEKDGSSVEGMEDLDEYDVPEGEEIIANRYKQPVSKRIERTLPGAWKTNGQVCVRQVDPLHFEILSIIPDIEILTRSDR